ncbi:hypothetical protein ACFVU0_12675 [Streptomyces sp. NPDC058122]|uniref:hypothetical protein n=1 Tax=Streptomyces sp. NPDC058122 TaxID=3346349 RepID=UPI0036E70252
MLDRVRRDMKHIGELMEGPGKETDEVDGDSMGVTTPAARMNDFGDEWPYGIKQIKKFSGAAVEELDKMKRAFEHLDDKLEEELRKSWQKCA